MLGKAFRNARLRHFRNRTGRLVLELLRHSLLPSGFLWELALQAGGS